MTLNVKLIERLLKAIEDNFDIGYTEAKARGDNMDHWFWVGHDITHNVSTIKYLLKEVE